MRHLSVSLSPRREAESTASRKTSFAGRRQVFRGWKESNSPSEGWMEIITGLAFQPA